MLKRAGIIAIAVVVAIIGAAVYLVTQQTPMPTPTPTPTSKPTPTPTPTPTPAPPSATGTLVLQVSDQPNAIGDFKSLVVKVSKVIVHSASENENTWLELQPSSPSFDLVQLQGDNVATLVSAPLKVGKYTQVRLLVVEANGTLKDNKAENVTVPSNELKLVHSFDITSGKTTRFVFDINVVKAGTKYNLTPVAGKVFTE